MTVVLSLLLLLLCCCCYWISGQSISSGIFIRRVPLSGPGIPCWSAKWALWSILSLHCLHEAKGLFWSLVYWWGMVKRRDPGKLPFSWKCPLVLRATLSTVPGVKEWALSTGQGHTVSTLGRGKKGAPSDSLFPLCYRSLSLLSLSQVALSKGCQRTSRMQ